MKKIVMITRTIIGGFLARTLAPVVTFSTLLARNVPLRNFPWARTQSPSLIEPSNAEPRISTGTSCTRFPASSWRSTRKVQIDSLDSLRCANRVSIPRTCPSIRRVWPSVPRAVGRRAGRGREPSGAVAGPRCSPPDGAWPLGGAFQAPSPGRAAVFTGLASGLPQRSQNRAVRLAAAPQPLHVTRESPMSTSSCEWRSNKARFGRRPISNYPTGESPTLAIGPENHFRHCLSVSAKPDRDTRASGNRSDFAMFWRSS
jgi:hypothetical protein